MEGFKKRHNISRLVSAGGITVLLTVLSLYLANILPTGRIFLFSLSTVFVAVMVIEFGNKAAFISFIASALLGILIIPNKLIMIPFVIYPGYYGIIKAIIEKRNNLLIEWLLKLLLFNMAVFIFYLLYIYFFKFSLISELPVFILLIIAQVYFIIYDYCFNLVVSYYKRFLHSIVNR